MIETFKYQVMSLYNMMDPVELEHLINGVFDEDSINTEIIFNGIDIQPRGEHISYIYDFTIIYLDVLDRKNLEYHMNKIQDLVTNTDSVSEPCDIILDLTVG